MHYILAVTSRALPGREAEYNRWYDDIHVGEVLALTGFLSCERFRVLDGEGRETGEFIAHYHVETDDPAALLQNLFAAAATMRMTDAIDTQSGGFTFLKPTRV